ncbi:hypothetical protein SCP_0103710 [Sparassis crispa]|uniref:Uncharacterized protein n=1 Tax=Sparassis crispa TaxID=139825 RepID=A0A401G5Q0_9APHY|nr:hypothetical protein SCP_0103710 [Sparassis crispa]GBE77496.1 hypothetical protein SCP_0103710 [Sparassis crispa]
MFALDGSQNLSAISSRKSNMSNACPSTAGKFRFLTHFLTLPANRCRIAVPERPQSMPYILRNNTSGPPAAALVNVCPYFHYLDTDTISHFFLGKGLNARIIRGRFSEDVDILG